MANVPNPFLSYSAVIAVRAGVSEATIQAAVDALTAYLVARKDQPLVDPDAARTAIAASAAWLAVGTAARDRAWAYVANTVGLATS